MKVSPISGFKINSIQQRENVAFEALPATKKSPRSKLSLLRVKIKYAILDALERALREPAPKKQK